ncbi:hypothetical protein ACU045_12235 [Microbacterium sp. MAHUQ-60]|uniref:hypothetical protein n=1 Tax=unclassified Microbacterium TaxID=2609290 RepID=UPI003609CE9B
MTDSDLFLTDAGVTPVSHIELEGARLAARLADSYAQRGRANAIVLEAVERVGPDLAPLVLFNSCIRFSTEVVPALVRTANQLAKGSTAPHLGEQYIEQAAAHVARIDAIIRNDQEDA